MRWVVDCRVALLLAMTEGGVDCEAIFFRICVPFTGRIMLRLKMDGLCVLLGVRAGIIGGPRSEFPEASSGRGGTSLGISPCSTRRRVATPATGAGANRGERPNSVEF